MINNARDLEIIAIQGIMSSKDGRHFVWRMLEQSSVEANTFNPDPYLHAHDAGRRSFGTWLKNELQETTISNYLLMIKEHANV